MSSKTLTSEENKAKIDSQFPSSNTRFALDTISVLFGSSFWSCLFSALASGGIFGAIMTFCLIDWGGTMGASIGGLIIGFVIVLLAKIVVLLVCRAMFFEALYRKRPAGANFMVRVRSNATTQTYILDILSPTKDPPPLPSRVTQTGTHGRSVEHRALSRYCQYASPKNSLDLHILYCTFGQ
jgi:hypothetical protein